MIRMSLSGQMFDTLPVWDHLEAAYSAGYEAIELRSTHANPNTDTEQLRKIRDYCNAHKLKVLSLSCFTGNYGLLSDEQCVAAFETFKKYVDLAYYMDSDMVRMWTAWQEFATAPQEIKDRAVLWSRKSCDYAAKHGKKVVLEMHHGTLCDTLEACQWMYDAIDRPNIGFCVDPVNLYQVPVEDVSGLIRALKGHIYIVHIKDIIKLPSPAYPYGFEYAYYAKHISHFTPVVPPNSNRQEYYSHRRINQGGVDWYGIIETLREIGYDGFLTVESVSENNILMPSGRDLAHACYEDIMSLLNRESKEKCWNIVSPEVEGFHEVISPTFRDCMVTHMFRLNLCAGKSFVLQSGKEEMNALLVTGKAELNQCSQEYFMEKLDSFYIPGGCTAKIQATEDCVFYIAAAVCEGYGKPFFRKLNLSLPVGNIHQIHGNGSGTREVFFTLDPDMPASRLLCGITWSADGAWTSWPPHQHEKDLEEVYCYLDETVRGAQIAYLRSGDINNFNFYPVKYGHMVLASKGYHPTIAMPGSKNVYFWVLTAFSHEQRRYDLAISDPVFD